MRFLGFVSAVAAAACSSATYQSPAKGGDTWYEAKSEHFTVRTNAGEEKAVDWLKKYERIYAYFAKVAFPSKEQPAGTTDVVMFNRKEEYTEIAPRLTDGFFRRRGGAIYDQHPMIVGCEGNDDDAIDRLFQHELTHRFVAFHFQGTPIWLNEGLAEFHETTRFEDGKVVIGNVPAGMNYSAEHGWYAWDHRGAYRLSELPPAESIRALSADDFYAKSEKDEKDAQVHVSRHYLAAWALTHVLMLGVPERRERLLAYLNGLATGEPNAWEKTFNAALLVDVDREYRAFLDRHETAHVTIDFPEQTEVSAKPRAMTPAEVHSLWAVTRSWDNDDERARAQKDIETSIGFDPKRAESYVLRAVLALTSGNEAAVDGNLDRALELEPENPNALSVRARLVLDAARKETDSSKTLKEAMATFADLKAQAKTAYQFTEVAVYEGMRGRIDSAIVYANRAVRADSSCWQCYLVGAELEQARGNLEVAVRVMRLALSLGSEEGAGVLLPRLRKLEAQQAECKASPSVCPPKTSSAEKQE